MADLLLVQTAIYSKSSDLGQILQDVARICDSKEKRHSLCEINYMKWYKYINVLSHVSL